MYRCTYYIYIEVYETEFSLNSLLPFFFLEVFQLPRHLFVSPHSFHLILIFLTYYVVVVEYTESFTYHCSMNVSCIAEEYSTEKISFVEAINLVDCRGKWERKNEQRREEEKFRLPKGKFVFRYFLMHGVHVRCGFINNSFKYFYKYVPTGIFLDFCAGELILRTEFYIYSGRENERPVLFDIKLLSLVYPTIKIWRFPNIGWKSNSNYVVKFYNTYTPTPYLHV